MAALMAAPLVAVRAQTAHAPDSPGHFLTQPAVSIGAIRGRCLALGDDTFAQDVPQIGVCSAAAVTSFGVAGGRRWYYTTVARRWLLADSAKGTADTVAESELILFSTGSLPHTNRDTLLTPVWHYRFEPEELASVTPDVVPADGGALLTVQECVNGTGGCGQSFFLERGGRWHVVRMAFLDTLNRRYPGAILHGFHVNVHTMRASAAVYSRGDANCCPSRVAEMRVRLRGESLELVELHVRANR